jgi:hypothetical protein
MTCMSRCHSSVATLRHSVFRTSQLLEVHYTGLMANFVLLPAMNFNRSRLRPRCCRSIYTLRSNITHDSVRNRSLFVNPLVCSSPATISHHHTITHVFRSPLPRHYLNPHLSSIHDHSSHIHHHSYHPSCPQPQ